MVLAYLLLLKNNRLMIPIAKLNQTRNAHACIAASLLLLLLPMSHTPRFHCSTGRPPASSQRTPMLFPTAQDYDDLCYSPLDVWDNYC